MNTAAARPSQTRSFSTIFLIELWERFGYYGMAAILVLFMVQKLGFDDARANLVWGAFTGLVYAAPAIGGWIGDNVLGSRRTMPIGAAILAIGYLLLAIPSDSMYFLYAAMGVVVVGNGLFKANAANMVRRIYEGDDAKIDSAFTLYYMAVNVGSTASMLLTPWIKDHWGWRAGFAVCCAGLVLGLINYMMMTRTLDGIGSPPDEKPVRWDRLGLVLGVGFVSIFVVAYIIQHQDVADWCVDIAGFAVLGIFAYMILKGTRSERAGLLAAFVLVVETLLFFIFYGQMSTSLTLFALRNVDIEQHLFSWTLFNWSPGQYQALNPIWIMALSPILAWTYTHFGKSGRDLPVAAKFALGFVVVAVGFFIFGISGSTAVNGQVSSWYMIWGYGFYSLGELLVSGLGLAMIARYVPSRMGGFMMGAYFVATGISQYMASKVANLASIPEKIGDFTKLLPADLAQTLANDYPGTLSLKLEDFRQWIGVLPTEDAKALADTLGQAHVTAFSSLSAPAQQTLISIDSALHLATMPIYTKLFYNLGLLAVGGTVLAFALLPLMKKLSATHSAREGVERSAAGGLRAVTAEE